MTGCKTASGGERRLATTLDLDEKGRGRSTHHSRVESHLSEASAFSPEQSVGLVAKQSFSHAAGGDAQQVAVPQSLHTLFLRPVDDTEHLQQQLEAWTKSTLCTMGANPWLTIHASLMFERYITVIATHLNKDTSCNHNTASSFEMN